LREIDFPFSRVPTVEESMALSVCLPKLRAIWLSLATQLIVQEIRKSGASPLHDDGGKLLPGRCSQEQSRSEEPTATILFLGPRLLLHYTAARTKSIKP